MANSSLEYDSLIRSFIDDPKFVSRDWLAAEVVDSLTSPQTTFVLLTAESGAGKTGVSASLAHAHPDWLRYFIRRDSRTPLSSGDAVSFLFSIGNQLAMRRPELFRPDKLEVVVKQRIEELQSGGRAVALTVDDLYVSPFYRTAIDVEQEVGIVGGNLEAMVVKRMVAEKRFLEIENLQYLALLDPAKVLEQQEPTAVIVILIDGLDEIRPSAEQRSLLDWLASSPAMRVNIKFVLTSRNDADLRVFRGAKSATIHDLTIEPDRNEVRTDVSTYLERFTFQPKVSEALTRNSIEPDVFVRRARRSARGNFGYLSTLARGILDAEERGDNDLVAQLLRLEKVPEQLTNLYEFFLSLMRDRIQRLGVFELKVPAAAGEVGVTAWEGVAQRVLGVLSVAREPLNPDQIWKLGSIRVWPRDLGNVLGEMLEFLDAEDGRYALFHASFADYLRSPATSHTAPDYYFDPLEWHFRIVRSYKGQATKWSEVNWAAIDDYGLLHLGEHLASSEPEMRHEITELVQPSARAAMLNRFLTDAAFLSLVNLATKEALIPNDAAAAMPQLVYFSSLKALLSETGDRMTPPVLGLMAKSGHIATALGYIDTMNPTTDRYYGLKATRANASAEDLGRAGDLVGLDRLETFAFDLPESSYRYAFYSQRAQTMNDFLELLAPVDLNRALRIAARFPKPEHGPTAEDVAVRSAALAAADPDRALELICRLESDVLETALDCTARLLPVAGDKCRPLLDQADAHIDLTKLSRETAVSAGRLIRAWATIDTEHAKKLWDVALPELQAAASGTKNLNDESGYDSLWSFSSIARNLWDFDSEGVQSLLASAFANTPDSADVHSFLEAARVYAENGARAEARALIDRALAVSRTYAPHALARDLAHAAQSMRTLDPDFTEQLITEAFDVLDNQQQAEAMRNDLTYAEMAHAFLKWDLDLALKAARRIQELHWTPFAEGLYGHDRTSVLVQIAEDQFASNRSLASSLLEECVSALTQVESIEGSEKPAQSGGIDLDAASLKQQSLFQTTFQLTYYLNALNHGMERRAWRVFDRPIELLYDLLAPPRLNAAPYFVERTLRRFVEAATTVDVNVAQNLTELIKNEAELAIAYAAIFDSTAKKDWDFAAQFAGAALQLIENVDATSAEILSEQFEILRWTNRNVRNRMETAMHLGRYHPPSMQQIMEAVDSKIMTLYLSFQMISKTVEAESAGMLESGTSLDDVIRFHLSTMSLLSVASDTTPGWVMAGYVLRTLGQYDLEKARVEVARFPVDGLGALLRIRVASGIVASNPSQASTWLREAVESLEADVTTSHHASVFGRAAAVIVQTDASLAGEWATEAMKIVRSISDPLQRGYAFIDLLRQEGLHSLVGQQVLLSELDECLVNSSSPDIEAELAMHAFPVLLELNPTRALNLFSSVASSHWITLLAMLDHGAETLTKVCGAVTLPLLANALDAAMAYLPSGLSGRK